MKFFRPALILLFVLGFNAQAQTSKQEGPSPEEIAKMKAELSGTATATVIYKNLSVIDGTNSKLQRKMSIVVQGDRISAVIPTSKLGAKITKDAEIVNAKGWYALPGLIDSHVHYGTLPARIPAEAGLKRNLYGGVTSVRDMAGDARALADLSRAALVNEIETPDIYYASLMGGPSFFDDPRTVTSGLGVTPGSVPWMKSITDKTDIPLAVAEARGTWATGIKIYANLPGNLVQGIIAEAKRQQQPVWSHLQVYPATPFDSLGATSVSHVCMIGRYILESDKSEYGHADEPSYEGLTVDHPGIHKYIAALAESGTIMDATLRLYAPEAAPRIATTGKGADNREQGPRPQCPIELAGSLVKAMHAAGVPIIAGTDGATPADDPFPALHEELELLVKHGGMTPNEAIQAATQTAAKALGKEQDLGTLEAGKYANILFLKKNPLKNISHTRSVVMTVKRGHRFPRSDYHHKPIPVLPFPERS